MYDKAAQEYFYQRTDPVYEGTIILDMVCPKVIVIDADAGEHHFVPENYGTSYQLFEKKKEFFGEFVDKPTLSDWAARYIGFMDPSENQHKQLIVCKAFTNVGRCEEDVIFWLNYGATGKVKRSMAKEDTPNIFKDERHEVVDMEATLADFYQNKHCKN